MKRKGIFYTVNGNYIQLVATSLTSIIMNIDEKFPVDIIIVSNDITDENKQTLYEILDMRKTQVNLLFRMPPDSLELLLGDVSNIFDNVVCWRIFMPYSLEEYSQLLYLDSDTLIYEGFEEIFGLLPQDKILGVIPDFYFFAINEKNSSKRGYFNSGVYMINVEKYIQKNSKEELLKNLMENFSEILYVDQTFLNNTFRGELFYLPLRFNYQKDDNWLNNWAILEAPESSQLFIKERANIKIRHFIEFGSHSMPWQHIEVRDQFEEYFWNVWNVLKEYRVKKHRPIKSLKMFLDQKKNEQIINLLERICTNFKQINFLDTDIAEGVLLGKYRIYFKSGYDENGGQQNGVIIFDYLAKRDFQLERFKTNFTTTDARGDLEKGWFGDTLLEIFEYIEQNQ